MKWTIPKEFVQDNPEVKSDSSNDIRLFLVIALDDPEESLNYILGMKYKWTDEADSVFTKEGPRVEVPYVGPLIKMSYAT